MEAALVKNADRMMLSAVALEEGIEVAFVDGQSGLIPFHDMPEVSAGGGVARLEVPNPYEIVAVLLNGESTEIPWDFARHYCDQSYRPRIEAIARKGRESLGRRIRERRESAGLTQGELAEHSAIGRVTLVRIEQGDQSPRSNTLTAIARALGLAVEDLLVGPSQLTHAPGASLKLTGELRVPAAEKIIDYVKDGLSFMFRNALLGWQATRQAEATQTLAKAHAKARALLVPGDAQDVSVELSIGEEITQHIVYREKVRVSNILGAAQSAQEILGDREVPDVEPDAEWRQRWVEGVQDVSTDELRAVYAQILAGKVSQPESVSMLTLSRVRDLDARTAVLFLDACNRTLAEYAIDGGISHRALINTQLGYSDLSGFHFSRDLNSILQQYGLVEPYESNFVMRREELHGGHHFRLTYGLGRMLFHIEGNEFVIHDCLRFTSAGLELSQVLDVPGDFQCFRAIKDFLTPETILVSTESTMAQSSPDGIHWQTPTHD